MSKTSITVFIYHRHEIYDLIKVLSLEGTQSAVLPNSRPAN
jgi:hypothetical protein